MKNQFYILVAAVAAFTFTGCSKDDDGLPDPDSSQFIRVQVPKLVLETVPIRVDVDVPCDGMPTVTFTTENNLLGVVSPVENPDFNTDYVYAGESIDVQYSNGHATATFWYLPLTRGDGNHAVNFTVNYTSNGEAKSATIRKVLNVEPYSGYGFYPEAVGNDIEYCYVFSNQEGTGKYGCDFRVAFISLNGKSDLSPNYVELTQRSGNVRPIPTVTMKNDVFYPCQSAKWSDAFQDWADGDVMRVRVWDDAKGQCSNKIFDAITFQLICRDNYHRCRDIVVDTSKDGKVTTTMGEYYLWKNKK